MADDLGEEYWLTSDSKQAPESDSDSASNNDAEISPKPKPKAPKAVKGKIKKDDDPPKNIKKKKRKAEEKEESETPTKKAKKKKVNPKAKAANGDSKLNKSVEHNNSKYKITKVVDSSDSDEGDQKESKDVTEEPKKKKKRKTKTEELAERGVSALSPEDLLQAMAKHYHGKLSAVEEDEIHLDAESDFSECNDMTHNPVSYMRALLPKWTKLVKNHNKVGDAEQRDAKPEDSQQGGGQVRAGSPLVLLISPAAVRATQLNRELESFKGEKCKTAKLFAKHFKIGDQVKFLSKSVIHLGLGTPSRIQALLENGALNLDNTRKIVIDWSWRDIKLRRLVEIPEIKTQLFELLKLHIIPRIRKGNCRIGLM